MKKIQSILSKIVLGLAITLVVMSPLLNGRVSAQLVCPDGQVSVNGVCVNITQNPESDTSLPNSPAGQGNYPETNTNTNNPNELTLTPNNAEDYKKGYQLLAPLDGFESFDTTQTCAFGKYLDIVINLFIGICAVLAVIMIVVGGIEYMTSELVSSKEHGKGQMTQAVLGLILALGAWLILNQLNPKLLELCLDRIPMATPMFDSEREQYSQVGESPSQAPVDGKAIGCPGKIITVSTLGGNMTGCSTIMNSVQAMINKAWSESPPVKISGSGYRSNQRQIELRIQNCGCSPTDNNCIYKKNPAQCTPRTARPGRSLHEAGLAFDLKCDGVQIKTRDNHCYLWLKKSANADIHKLRANVPGELWHWSATGN